MKKISKMELDVGGNESNVETVEVVAGIEDAVIDPTRLSNHSTAAGLLEQQLVVGSAQEILVPTTEVSAGIQTHDLNMGLRIVETYVTLLYVRLFETD